MADNDYAVVIGINRYPNPPLGDLLGPENDATGFRDWLISPVGGAVPDDREHVHLILSRDYPDAGTPLAAKPTTEEVDRAFEEILESVRIRTSARRLYMFFAGHGIAPQTELNEAALLMANAGRDRMGHNIPGRLYAQSLQLGALFQEMVLFMDCCRDNYLRARFHNPPWDVVVRVDAADVAMFSGFATRWSRKSRERDLEDQGTVRGLFSHAVLTALRSGRLTGSQLRDRVYNHLRLLVRENEYQEPEFAVDSNRDIVFSEAAPPASSRVRVSFTPGTIGHRVEIEDGDFQTCGVHDATAQPWDLGLGLGKYRICDNVNGNKKVFAVLEGVTNVDF